MALYEAGLDSVVPVSHARVAESCKLLENIFRSVNIALVNEMKMTFSRTGIDVWEVRRSSRRRARSHSDTCDTRNMVGPLFGEGLGGGPKRLVKA